VFGNEQSKREKILKVVENQFIICGIAVEL
jgi:hypothetical protein